MIIGIGIFGVDTFANGITGLEAFFESWIEICPVQTLWTDIEPKINRIVRCEDDAN